MRPRRRTEKESAANSDWIASLTAAFSPWTSDTTAMIDVTATTLPTTVSSDRSLFVQIACSAMRRRFEELVHQLPAWRGVVPGRTGR